MRGYQRCNLAEQAESLSELVALWGHLDGQLANAFG